MDVTFVTQHFMPVVLTACLVVGYILKAWIKDLENKYIPTILGILGALLGCIAGNQLSLDNIVYGAVTGLASTGMHQAFRQILNNQNKTT